MAAGWLKERVSGLSGKAPPLVCGVPAWALHQAQSLALLLSILLRCQQLDDLFSTAGKGCWQEIIWQRRRSSGSSTQAGQQPRHRTGASIWEVSKRVGRKKRPAHPLSPSAACSAGRAASPACRNVRRRPARARSSHSVPRLRPGSRARSFSASYCPLGWWSWSCHRLGRAASRPAAAAPRWRCCRPAWPAAAAATAAVLSTL